jgi:hypothetical protein
MIDAHLDLNLSTGFDSPVERTSPPRPDHSALRILQILQLCLAQCENQRPSRDALRKNLEGSGNPK